MAGEPLEPQVNVQMQILHQQPRGHVGKLCWAGAMAFPSHKLTSMKGQGSQTKSLQKAR